VYIRAEIPAKMMCRKQESKPDSSEVLSLAFEMPAGPPQHTAKASIMEYQTGNKTLLLYSSAWPVFLLLMPLTSHIILPTLGQRG